MKRVIFASTLLLLAGCAPQARVDQSQIAPSQGTNEAVVKEVKTAFEEPSDPKKPLPSFEEKTRVSAEQGDKEAQSLLGFMYYSGEGVPQDYREAAKWYTMAAEQGDAPSQYYLGRMYYRGEGVPQDYKEVAKWLTKAAEQGDPSAQYNLGLMYFQGKGVPQDYKEAAKWYTMAAEQGHADAQSILGAMYFCGRGVLEDYVEAYKWFLLATMNGAEGGLQAAKEDARQRMTPGQIEEAQRRAQAFTVCVR